MTNKPTHPADPKSIQFEIPADLPLEYINMVRIAHSPMDLLFDFAQILPGGTSQVRSRVIMSPLGAKLFLRALAENLNKYEASFGEIYVPGDTSMADFLFKTPDRDKNK